MALVEATNVAQLCSGAVKAKTDHIPPHAASEQSDGVRGPPGYTRGGPPLDSRRASDMSAIHGASSPPEDPSLRLPVNRRGMRTKCTPLHAAAYAGHADVVRLLLDAGATVCPLSAAGKTPLHMACSRGWGDAALLLVVAGADPYDTAHGEAPISLLRKWGGTESASTAMCRKLAAAWESVGGMTQANDVKGSQGARGVRPSLDSDSDSDDGRPTTTASGTKRAQDDDRALEVEDDDDYDSIGDLYGDEDDELGERKDDDDDDDSDFWDDECSGDEDY
mmetsp:Transcript_2903/g.8399  ORF Transcript_2903/g.8399 Transcript_2903/m.8399 type:complete len:278 (+) Transcript_2903:86-919(+)